MYRSGPAELAKRVRGRGFGARSHVKHLRKAIIATPIKESDPIAMPAIKTPFIEGSPPLVMSASGRGLPHVKDGVSGYLQLF